MRIIRVCIVYRIVQDDKVETLGNARGEYSYAISGGDPKLSDSCRVIRGDCEPTDWKDVFSSVVRTLAGILWEKIGENARIISTSENLAADNATFIFYAQG